MSGGAPRYRRRTAATLSAAVMFLTVSSGARAAYTDEFDPVSVGRVDPSTGVVQLATIPDPDHSLECAR